LKFAHHCGLAGNELIERVRMTGAGS